MRLDITVYRQMDCDEQYAHCKVADTQDEIDQGANWQNAAKPAACLRE